MPNGLGEQGIEGPAPARPVCRRANCGHWMHSGPCATTRVFPAAIAHLAPENAVPAGREHLPGTLLAACECPAGLS